VVGEDGVRFPVEVRENGKWITSARYKETHGKWPSGKLEHRLQPDKGDYKPFLPK